jgi:hypothetical protein
MKPAYKESKRESKKDERKEPPALKAYEKKMGLEKKPKK